MRWCGLILFVATISGLAGCESGKPGPVQTPASLMAAPTVAPVNPAMPVPNIPK
jgi:hypothetical protein